MTKRIQKPFLFKGALNSFPKRISRCRFLDYWQEIKIWNQFQSNLRAVDAALLYNKSYSVSEQHRSCNLERPSFNRDRPEVISVMPPLPSSATIMASTMLALSSSCYAAMHLFWMREPDTTHHSINFYSFPPDNPVVTNANHK